jgi:putative spermidine/putrescine transport system ATP-binding protein
MAMPRCCAKIKKLSSSPKENWLVNAIEISGLSKFFGSLAAVDNLTLSVAAGEFFSMLGPSGSGKTTVLRLIAGFELADSGSILIDGVDVSRLPAFSREVNTVFQDYALFPHMSVLENVAYGLRIRGVGRKERTNAAELALEQVKLGGFGHRTPNQLSGGQRQRVALARAIVLQPKVLLLDEPLGALDLKLRQEMQLELKQLQRDLGMTFIFVTHDQEEALSMSDRVAVFRDGRVEQVGTPSQIYSEPRSEFVADFVGSSNLFTADEARSILGRDESCAIRPERLRLDVSRGNSANLTGVVLETVFSGSTTKVWIEVEEGKVLVSSVPAVSEDRIPARGDTVSVAWNEKDLVTFG